ncbi:hypothetical protein ACF0H5_019630 [Mactra antiquata]
MLDASQGNQGRNQPENLPEFPTERCNRHKGKCIDMFCEEHNEVGCYICISAHYKSCPEKSIYSVPDMIDTLFKLGDCEQIQSRLTAMMASLTELGKSKEDKLQALTDVKNEEIEKVLNFQKALESIIRKAAEVSRHEIENNFSELENEILEEKQNVQVNGNSLKETEDKLKKAEGNRAQRFVCCKIADKTMKEADSQISKQKDRTNDGKRLVFTPNQSLMKYVDGLHGIGMVGVNTRMKTDIYQMKGSQNINIKVNGDSKTCSSAGCCLTFDNQLLVTDYTNHKLKLINTDTMTVEDDCQLDSAPYGVCCINDSEAAIACSDNKIQLVSFGTKMTLTRQIKTSHVCYGITTRNDKIYVTDNGSSLYIYDMSGNLLQTISQDNAGNKLISHSRHVTFSESGEKMYICNWNKGIVCLDDKGNYQSTFSDIVLKIADGVCLDGRGNIYVVDYNSHNVVQFNEEGKMIGVIIKQQDGLQQNPHSACFYQELNRLFVTMNNSDVLKMFELY